MKKMALETLLKETPSIFELSNMAAMRAMELNGGMKKLVEANPKDKFTTIALKEIFDGKVKLKKRK